MQKKQARLYILSGLPGSGKTTLAKMLAARLKAAHLRIDTIEQGLKDLYGVAVAGEGYELAQRIAKDNLLNGVDVIADSVNPWQLTREAWQGVAEGVGAEYLNIEVVCTDAAGHRQRVENRETDIQGLKLPSWEEVLKRDYHAWQSERVWLDTAGKTAEQAFQELWEKIAGVGQDGPDASA